MYYIQEDDKPNFIFKLFNIVQLRQDKIILPIDEKNISSKKAQKLAKKTKRILNKTISKKVVISEKVQEQEEYVNYLYSYNLEIIEGIWLFEVLSGKILDCIIQKRKMKKEETSISILVNDITENMLANLRKIAGEYKLVNIVTNHIEKFRKIENQILEKDGIMITVGNNKKRGLLKSEIIINVDFPQELINQYTIYENAIIINIRENIKIATKRFNGICVNNYDISFQNEEFDYDKETKFKQSKIYEAKINKRQPFNEIIKQIEKDKVKITKLMGINSRLKWKNITIKNESIFLFNNTQKIDRL